MKHFLKRAGTVLMALALFCSLGVLSACGGRTGGGSGNGETSRIFCRADGFFDAKQKWFGDDELLSEEAKASAVTELYSGEIYWFVYTFSLISLTPDVLDDYYYTIENYFEFRLKTFGGLLFGTDAVSFVDFECCGVDAEFDFVHGTVEIANQAGDIRAYLAVSFVPNTVGMLCVEGNVYGDSFRKAEDTDQWVSASVLSAPAATAEPVEVTDLSYGLINEEVYNSGPLSESADLAAISEMKKGKNYVVIDFVVEAKQEVEQGGEVYCGVYLYEGAWQNVVLEEVNTGKYSEQEYNGGMMYDFSYTAPETGSKKVRTVLSFEALETCLIDIDFYVFSDVISVQGNTFEGAYFSEENVSDLSFEINEDTQVCAVTGINRGTGTIIIPNRYEGMRVVEVGSGAFSGEEIAALETGESLRIIDENAFRGCTFTGTIKFAEGLQKILRGGFYGSDLRQITFPQSLLFIGSKAFAECDLLKEVIFENSSLGWTVVTAQGNLLVDGSYREFATYLRDEYSAVDWHFFPVLRVRNLQYSIVEAEDFSSGNLNNTVSESNLDANKEYYLVVSFEAEKVSDCAGAGVPKIQVYCSGPQSGDSGFIISESRVISGNLYSSEGGRIILVCSSDVGETNTVTVCYRFRNTAGGRTVKLTVQSDRNAILDSTAELQIMMSSAV